MKKIIIFFILLMSINLIFAQEINLEYENNSNGENITFSLEIIDFPEGIYDVKIDLFGEEKRISQIWDEKWKSTNYYVLCAIKPNEQKDFFIRVLEHIGEANIIVKIRDSQKKIFVFENYSINITEIVEEIPKESEDENQKINEGDKIDYKEITEEEISDKEEFSNKEQNYLTLATKQEKHLPIVYETISLNPKNIKTNKNYLQVLKDNKKYSIIGFCLILLILYKLTNKKRKNEFRDK